MYFAQPVSNARQIIAPGDMLDTAEEKWAPPNDPVFQLVPLDFESYVVRCFEELGELTVELESFWDVYRQLRDLVELAVPDVVAATLGESIADDDDSAPEPIEFALDDAEFDDDEDGEDDDDEGEMFCVDFTNEEDEDQLY